MKEKRKVTVKYIEKECVCIQNIIEVLVKNITMNLQKIKDDA